jgi:hypothetical protein
MFSTFTDKQLRTTFYLAWLTALLLQCALVGLSGDEAYYWRYSQQLAWGYFDHPPVTALLVRVGTILLPGELGVRLFFALMSAGLIYAMERLVQPANLRLFYAIILSIAFLQLGMVLGGGMMALPDVPLIFFEALFFLLYKDYLDKPRAYVYVLLPLVIALMLLSKYHGVLVIGFVILSNPALLRRWSFWLMGLGTALLILPHALWQVTNNFPSIRYHLLERSTNPYKFSFTLEYLASQPFVLGPLISIILIYCAFVFDPGSRLERALRFTAIGTYAFFLVMTIKGRVEGNWTIIALVPLVYMGYSRIETSLSLTKWTRIAFVISFALILFARVIITAKIPLGKFTESLSPEIWTARLNQKTNGKPVGFINSYQKAALYEFYERVPSFSLNNLWGRKNQYTLWDTEANHQGQDVALVWNWETTALDSIRIDGEYYPIRLMENFRSSSNLLIRSDLDDPLILKAGTTWDVNLRFSYASGMPRDLESNKESPTTVVYGFFRGTTAVQVGYTGLAVQNEMIGHGTYGMEIKAPLEPGHYKISFGALTGFLPAGINSAPVSVVVE